MKRGAAMLAGAASVAVVAAGSGEVSAGGPRAWLQPKLTLSDRAAPVGTRIRIRGRGFARRRVATIRFGGGLLRRVRTGRRGGLLTAVRVPKRSPGAYTLSVRTGRRVARARFRIPAPRAVPAPAATPAQAAPQPAPSPERITMVAAGDIACRTGAGPNGTTTPQCQHLATSDRVLALNPDVVAPLGDIQYEEPDDTFEYFQPGAYNDTWGRFKSITRPAIGNHEYQGDPERDSANAYTTYFGITAGDPSGFYYAYDIGNWRAIALNSGTPEYTRTGAGSALPDDCYPESCAAGSDQVQWLRAELAALPPDKCVVAYWHHPRFDSLPQYNYPELRPIYEALYDGGAEVALVGHDHSYERFAPTDEDGNVDQAFGVSQFVVGLGGKDRRFANPTTLLPASEYREPNLSGPGGTALYGVLELELRPDGWVSRLVGTDGAVRDQDGGTCHGRPG